MVALEGLEGGGGDGVGAAERGGGAWLLWLVLIRLALFLVVVVFDWVSGGWKQYLRSHGLSSLAARSSWSGELGGRL